MRLRRRADHWVRHDYDRPARKGGHAQREEDHTDRRCVIVRPTPNPATLPVALAPIAEPDGYASAHNCVPLAYLGQAPACHKDGSINAEFVSHWDREQAICPGCRLKRLAGQEARFAKDVNHCLSKRIVATAGVPSGPHKASDSAGKPDAYSHAPQGSTVTAHNTL
jgi:hypothetical protein